MQDREQLTGITLRDTYRLDELVSESELTAVFRASKLGSDRSVAIKCLAVDPDRVPERGVASVDDFLRKSRLLALIARRSNATPRVLDMGVDESRDTRTAFLVTEWLEGESLTAILERQGAAMLSSWSFGDVVGRMREPLVALAKAHSVGVCHGDMGPHSLFVCGDIEDPAAPLKLLNLGYCLETRGGQPTPFQFHPQYAAPEHFLGHWGKIANATDVFSVALLLVELMLGGHPALRGSSLAELAQSATDTSLRPTPRARGIRVVNAIESAFAKALQVDCAARFQHLGEFIADLDYALANQPRPQTQLESDGRPTVAGAIDTSGE